jgi:anti-sigma regulatory factor (Ser/Thr protein kinase)
MGEAPRQAPRVAPLVAPASLLSETVDGSRVTELRHAVGGHLRTIGLAGDRLEDFVLAINELLTNVVRHGGGTGWLRLWRGDRDIVCEVSDRGPGLSAGHVDRLERPVPGAVGGWGLWLADRLSDSMSVQTGPAGTTIRITTTLPRDAGPDLTD